MLQGEHSTILSTFIKLAFSVNNILFKYKVHQDTTDTSYIQYNTFERDTEISLRLVFDSASLLAFVIKTIVLSILSGPLRQVLLYLENLLT